MSYGRSVALDKNTFVRPPDEKPPDEKQVRIQLGAKSPTATQGQSKRHAKVYDAVAGRVNTRGFIRSIHDSKYRDTASSNLVPSRPDEVIFRRKNAPIRYEETDFYYAHESLPPDCPLPSSELLVAIHAYAADFYHHTTRNHGRHDRESMNDTALIAMGILIEEMAKESLGKTGDLVLVEGEDVSDDEHEKVPLSQADRSRGLKRRRPGHFTAPGILGNDLDDVVQKIRQPKSGRKRRKVLREAPTETITLDDG